MSEPKIVMVVDDDAQLRESVCELLEEDGYKVVPANSGVAALDSLRSAAQKPDVILLDLMMPVMNGYEFREAQLGDPDLATIPVVVMTANRNVRGIAADEVISKPVKLAKLLDVVRRHARGDTAASVGSNKPSSSFSPQALAGRGEQGDLMPPVEAARVELEVARIPQKVSTATPSAETLSRIEARLGFVPPFFAPAIDNPMLLANLWQQTESAYLDNPLPTLFKEKLAALLGRYCEVAYCLMCHTCSLRPLGMQGPAILTLLTSSAPSDEDITRALHGMDELADNVVFPIAAETEELLFCLASAIYFAGPLASSARERLRKRLSVRDYQSLIVLTTYNKMCHEWMAAHPDVSYTLDQRYVQNWGPISKDAPAIADVFASRSVVAPTRDFESVAARRAAETERLAEISEQRFDEVLRALNERVTAAIRETSEQEDLAAELRRTSAFAQDLLAIVSHDLRNPLNAIELGVTLALQRLGPTHEVARPLQRVLASSLRAERLVHDLLDFSQARAGGGIPIDLQPMDLHEVARAAAEEFLGAHPGIVLRVTAVGPGAGEWDPDRLRQVLGNLLTNARVHGRDHSTIELSARVDAEVAQITVHNENANGPIAHELLPVLFDPFKRGVARRFSRTRSVGLGLYIVDQIVRGHRGRITVVSNAETTAFTITVPRAATSPTQAARME